MKVLLVDDDPITLKVLSRLVEEQAHEVECASDGDDGWRRFAAGDHQVVICDWMMPGIDGLEFIRRIRAGVRSFYTYVVMITARSEREEIERVMAAGADDYLTKPVCKDDLIARLRVAGRIVALHEQLLAQNREMQAVNQRMHKALESAVKVQRLLLPAKLPAVADMHFAWVSRPCDQLGGDTLNLFQLDEHHLALYILDVSGHGVGSALLAVQVSRLLTPLMSSGSLLKVPIKRAPGYRLVHPLQVLEELNRQFPFQPEAPQFFTMLYGLYDLRDHQLTLASAGHPGPTLVRADGSARSLDFSSNPIGLFDSTEAEFEVQTLDLAPGDRLYLYSDGVLEAADHASEVFDRGHLEPFLAGQSGVALDASIAALLVTLDGWRAGAPASDDISVLALERVEVAAVSADPALPPRPPRPASAG